MGMLPPAATEPTLAPALESLVGAEVPQGLPPVSPVGPPMGGPDHTVVVVSPRPLPGSTPKLSEEAASG
ncbi:hypothetical protein B296_00025843 [Ensete ventricosum]|uniref:Uncharacterized protein n=1 Tax=Ensete ventricosum TaxID=4639 RepID=A0A426YTD7_ENSVE|nr:hypothetical protein B296_00025843 [Ensete ventricosum]